MKTLLYLGLFSILLLSFSTSCKSDNEPQTASMPNYRAMKSAESALLTSSNQFCFDYFQLQSANEPSKNILFSPYSAHAALGMLIHGSDGITKQEIKDALRISLQTDEDVKTSFKSLKEYLLSIDPTVTLDIANSIWARKGYALHPNFVSTLKDYYQADITSLDFDDPLSPKTINNWVSNKTAGRIPSIVDQLTPDDMMVLINAVYFKADWKTKFDSNKTTKASFVKDDGAVIAVDMMQSDKMEAWHTSNADAELIDIPFGNGAYSYSILMPSVGKKLDDFVNSFSVEKWNTLLANAPGLNDSIGQIHLKMPRFKFSYEQKMTPLLQTMGMKKAFTELAELPYLFASDLNLMVSYVKQKAFIQVDEKGGEAAAVTSIGVGVTSIGLNEYITVNRPFLFLIRERSSNSILFIGKMHSPEF